MYHAVSVKRQPPTEAAATPQLQARPCSVVGPRCAFALVNGIQLLQCAIPTMAEGVCSVEAEAQPMLQTMPDHGRFEVSVLLYSSLEVPRSTWVVELTVDDDSPIFLGQMPLMNTAAPETPTQVAPVNRNATMSRERERGPAAPTVIITRYFRAAPRRLRLAVRYLDHPSYPHPDESILLDELLRVFRDERMYPPGTLTPHTNLHNRLKDLTVYHRVVGEHYRGNWLRFLFEHAEAVDVHREPKQEYKLALANDPRPIVPPLTEEQEGIKEFLVVSTLVGFLADGPRSYKDLLLEFGDVEAFTESLHASTHMLQRFLAARPDIFWLSKDPIHTTRVGLVANRPSQSR